MCIGMGYVLCNTELHITEETEHPYLAAINVSLAFNMGQDMDGILSNAIGQPLATVCGFSAGAFSDN